MAYMPLDKSKLYLDKSKMTRIYDLSNGWGVDAPLWPMAGARTDAQFPRGQYLSRFHKRCMTYTGTLHVGTHMDAPIHTLHQEEVDRDRNGYYLSEIPLEYCVGTGVILDMRYLRDEFEEKFQAAGGDPAKFGDIWYHITIEDVEKACKQDGLEIRENDWVVINTGFQHYWKINNDKYYNYYPALCPEAAYWLIHEKHIKGISGTWGATDGPLWHYPLKEQSPWLWKDYLKATGVDADTIYPDYEPNHRMFAQAGVCCVENGGGEIDNCTGRRMIVAAFPFKCEVADGGFVRLVAWEEGSF